KAENNTIINNINGTTITGSSISFFNNIVKYNKVGIITNGSNNRIYNNHFINNNNQITNNGVNNKLFFNYDIGGNFWSDYDGVDRKKGPNQDQWGSDGYGDDPYRVGGLEDKYPLVFDTMPPVANAGEDVTINEGLSHIFSAELSTDDNLVMDAWWNFTYDGIWQNRTGLSFEFLFDIPGYYPVDLTVFDFRRNRDSDSFNITVLDVRLPNAVSQGDLFADEGSTLYFNGSGSWDTGGIA
ncbi:MAG: PKD domain-containing protein, partial [Candidatus Thermoplasmatota archaeon]|nr:PKD domain-containing protein [Candidatus Thermoplasmatota archaeon]